MSCETSTLTIDSAYLEKESKIYGRSGNLVDLSEYQKAVNDASLELEKQDCSLLQDQGELFARARKRVDDEGYRYKKSFSIYCLWKTDYPIKTNEETSVLAQ